jgi:hypothetical protein
MGRLVNGINGPIIGKVGTVIGSTYMGEHYIKAKSSTRKRRKRAKKVAANNDYFSDLHAYMKPLTLFIREGFKGYHPRMHAFNAAKSFNLRNAFDVVKKAKVFNPGKVQVSFGTLPLPADIRVVRTDPRTLQFTWDAGSTDGSRYDQAMLLAYDPKSAGNPKSRKMKLTGQFRNTGRDELIVESGKRYEVYIAFVAADRKSQSHSQYLGTIEP